MASNSKQTLRPDEFLSILDIKSAPAACDFGYTAAMPYEAGSPQTSPRAERAIKSLRAACLKNQLG